MKWRGQRESSNVEIGSSSGGRGGGLKMGLGGIVLVVILGLIMGKNPMEMLGLVASMVLRCDDCIKYHLGKCHELGLTTDEVYEIFSVANIVGGTIVIPHTRRGAEYWEALQSPNETK